MDRAKLVCSDTCCCQWSFTAPTRQIHMNLLVLIMMNTVYDNGQMSYVLKMCRAALNLQCLAHMPSIILPADTRKDKDSFYTVQSPLKHWCRRKSGRIARIKEGKMCQRKAISVRRHPRLNTTTTSSLRHNQSVRCTQIESTSWKIHRNGFTIKLIFLYRSQKCVNRAS